MGRLRLQPIGNALVWLWRKTWAWGPVAWIGAVCISASIVLVQEQMYRAGRGLLTIGLLLLFLKVSHDVLAEGKPAAEIVTTVLASGVVFGLFGFSAWQTIDRIVWNHEVVIKMTFKSSPVFTAKRRKEIVWNLNEYYRYLQKVGFEFPTEIPPLGLTPPHGLMLGGGTQGPAYYSSLFIPEDSVDNPDVLRSVYSSYIFDRILVWPDAYKTGFSRAEAEDDEEAAWIFSCYFPASYSGHRVCSNEVPGHNWLDALWETRNKYGQDYTDSLLCYTMMTWGVPSKYADNFDRFFRYRLVGGESVVGVVDLDAVFTRYGLDVGPN